MPKILVIGLAVPLGWGLIWGARWVGVPRPYDTVVVMSIALTIIAVEWYRARS